MDGMQCKKVFILQGSRLILLSNDTVDMVKDGVLLVGLVAGECLAKAVLHTCVME